MGKKYTIGGEIVSVQSPTISYVQEPEALTVVSAFWKPGSFGGNFSGYTINDYPEFLIALFCFCPPKLAMKTW